MRVDVGIGVGVFADQNLVSIDFYRNIDQLDNRLQEVVVGFRVCLVAEVVLQIRIVVFAEVLKELQYVFDADKLVFLPVHEIQVVQVILYLLIFRLDNRYQYLVVDVRMDQAEKILTVLL